MSNPQVEVIDGPIANEDESVIFQVTLPSGAVMTRPFADEPKAIQNEPQIIVTEQGRVILLSA